MKMKTLAVIMTLVMIMTVFSACTKKESALTTSEIGVVRDEEFGNIYIELSIEDFNALGFAFGDSLNISFDNGKTFEDVPYYSGYYVPVGEMLACGYPGYPHVVIAENYGPGTWDKFEMTDESKVTITLNEKGKYAEREELFGLTYSDDRNDFDSDIIFANFREVEGGNIKAKTVYRSASPCDNQHNRAKYANKFCEEYGIKFVLNLSDNEEKYTSYVEAEDFESEYYDSLYSDGNVLLLAMNANYRSDDFAKTISKALFAMSQHKAPCLIHCVEGKDRTGFVCALILALAGADAQEIIDDYMITYDNYYGVNKETKPEKYEAILDNVYDFMYCLCDAEKGADIKKLDLKAGAESYLKRGGLTDDQIKAVEGFLS